MDKNLLKRATEDTPDPTPGYMYRDIAQWTFLDHNTQTKLVTYLMDKLKPNVSNNILWKVLRIIKNLCESGHADFQKEMQRHADTIKGFASYRGNQDPKYGDKLNEKVRVAAREAMEAAFSRRRDTSKVQISGGHGSTSTGEFSGTGSSSTAAGSGSSGSFVTGQAVGSGNSGSRNEHMADMPTTNKWAEHMANGGHKQSQLSKDIQHAVKTGFGLWQEPIKSKEERMNDQLAEHGDFKAVELPVGGFGGGGSSTAGTSEWKFTEEQSGAAAGVTTVQETRMLTPFQKEVERIAAFKSTPQRVDLSNFVTTVQELNSQGSDYDDLAEAMDGKISQKNPWQQRLNVLVALEALLRQNVSSQVSDYFKENPEDIQRNLHVVQSSLKEKASKVLKMLGVPEKTGATTTAPVQEAKQTTSFGGDNMWSSSVPVATTSSTEAAEAPAGGDLDFGGMAVKSTGRRAKKEGGAEDKTKLRKRATMQAAQEDQTSAWNTTTTSDNNNGGGFGDWGNTNTTTTTTDNSGWGNTGGWGTEQPAEQPQQPQQAPPQPAQPPVQKNDDFDAFFTSTPAQPAAAPVVPPQPTPAPVPAAPAQPAQPTPTPTQPPAQNAALMQMQQQMAQLMQQMSSPQAMQDPAMMQQMQMMMQQQQQMMAMMMQQQQTQAPPAAEPVVPHSHFSAPQAHTSHQNQAFNEVQEEMKRRMMQGQ